MPGQHELLAPDSRSGGVTPEHLALPGVQDVRDHQLVLGAQRRG